MKKLLDAVNKVVGMVGIRSRLKRIRGRVCVCVCVCARARVCV